VVRRIPLCFLIIVCGTASSACWAAATSCPNAPRVIGPFGAENTKNAPLAIDPEIRSQLPGFVSVTDVLQTHLSRSGEQVIVYSTDRDESNPAPKLAFVVSGKVKQVLAAADISSGGGGFWRYQSGCQYQITKILNGLALAFTTGFDGAASAFAVVIWKANGYSVVFNPLVSEGRMLLSLGHLAVWGSDGKGECVWCKQRYTVTNYQWQGETYAENSRRTLPKMFDPAAVSGTPLVIAAAPGNP